MAVSTANRILGIGRLDSSLSKYTAGFFAFVLVVAASFFTVTPVIKFSAENCLDIVTYCMIGLFSLVSIYFGAYSRPFSLNTAHWVFVFFFFCYTPLVQFLTDSFPGQADMGFTHTFLLEANGWILAWCLCYTVAYRYLVGRARPVASLPRTIPPLNYALLTLFALAAAVFTWSVIGVHYMLSRAVDEAGDSVNIFDSPLSGIGSTCGRAIPFLVCCVVVFYGDRNRTAYWVSIAISGLCGILCNLPTSAPRFWTGALLVGLSCLFSRNRFRTALWMPIIFFAAYILVMPFLDLFRYNSATEIDYGSYKPQGIQAVSTGGDYDAYEMFVNSVGFLQDPSNASMGVNLIGNTLFFVPRIIWRDKPTSSEDKMIKNSSIEGMNLSCPLPAEGVLNFGKFGVILYSVVFGLAIAKLDVLYWLAADQKWRNPRSLIVLVYPFLVGFVTFFMRGSYLSAFAYVSAFVLSGWFVLTVAYCQLKGPKAFQSMTR